MNRHLTIEAVPPADFQEALEVIAGAGRHASPWRRAEDIRRLADASGPDGWQCWRARRAGRTLAAALVLHNAGRTGTLFFSPPGEAGAAPAVGELLQAAVGQALDRGLSLVHCLLSPRSGRRAATLREAGFVRLAELVYMDLPLRRSHSVPADASLAWRNYDQFGEAELCELIARTYSDSLDCPAMSGVRRVEDVLAGHKASGVFQPQAWWIVDRCGSPAGCVLVNDSPSWPLSEVVYLGVAPEHRGWGLGRAMIERSAALACRRGSHTLTLAVDAANSYAMSIYRSAGFRATHRRCTYAFWRRRT